MTFLEKENLLNRSVLELYRTFFKNKYAAELSIFAASDSKKRQELAKAWNALGLNGKQRQGVKRAIETIVRQPKT